MHTSVVKPVFVSRQIGFAWDGSLVMDTPDYYVFTEYCYAMGNANHTDKWLK